MLTAALLTIAGAASSCGVREAPAIDAPRAELTIMFDGGGVVSDFVEKFVAIRVSGGHVKLDGMCLSACALVTMLPAAQICVTPAATLGFHSATQRGVGFHSQTTGTMWHLFPKEIRNMVIAKGWDGLTEHDDFVFLEYDDLKTLYADCI